MKKILWPDETKIDLLGVNARRCSLPAQYHPNSEAWWWQHHAVVIFFSIKNGVNSQDRGKDDCSNEQKHSGWKSGGSSFIRTAP